MTAIAYRDGIMAADSMLCGGDFARGTVRKIARSVRGTIGAASGLAGPSWTFLHMLGAGRIDTWIDGGCASRLPIDEERGMFGAIIVTRDHGDERVICVDRRGFAVEFVAAFYVEGCAEQIMFGAMAAGASAEEAVRIAIQYDTGCGGEVQVERLNCPTRLD